MSIAVAARLLGPPQVTIAGEAPPPELLWRKHLALCIALWTAPEGRRSRDRLIGMLWSDKTDRAARHSLNEGLRVIRRAAGANAIDTDGDAVTWRRLPELDTSRFVALEGNDPAAAAELAVGPFCDGLVVPGAQEFESWLSGERDRWQAKCINVLARAGGAAEDRGDVRRALALAERAVALNGLSDLAARGLIRAHWLSGDRAAALAAGEGYRQRLDRELGVELDELTTSLLARVTRERLPARPKAATPVERRSPLIGRASVLADLLAHSRDVATPPRPRLLVISGPGGSGRSRLLEEIVARAVMAGTTVATLRAVEVDRDDPEAAVLGLARAGLAAAPGVAGAPSNALAPLVAHIAEWADRFPKVPVVDPLPLRDGFAAVVRATAEERPILLAIDDADRLHPEELLWFAALLRAVNGLPATLLLTASAGAGSIAMDELTRRAGRDVVGTANRLDPLTQADVRALVDWAVPAWSEEARDRLARRVWAESAGLPAIAVDVLHAVEHGLAVDGAAWPAPDRTFDATLPGPLPEPLVAAIRIAFRRLGPDAQQLLSAASLIEEPFSADRAAAVAAIDDPVRRDTALDALEWERWIVMDARGYSFPARAKRRLIAEEMLTPGQRRRLEERIATCR